MSEITTPGALLIQSMLPTEAAKKEFSLTQTLDSKGVKGLVTNLLKNGGPQAYDTINTLSQLFFHKAYEHGYSTPISDYLNDSEERQAEIKEFEIKANDILRDKSLSNDQKQNKLGELAGAYEQKMNASNVAYLMSRGSTAAKMAQTGARGNPSQLRQATSTPVMGSSVGGIVPLVIRHSYAEGMTAGEQMALSYGGRSNTIAAQTATSLPGALFKRIAPTVYHEVITTDDCHTHNGINRPIHDKHSILGRYEAGTNRLITDSYYRELEQANRQQVRVRSSLTCEASEGVCQKCYGLAANGKLPPIGENIGILGAQSVSENLTQAVLGTKHVGGTAGKKRDTYSIVSNILRNPENFQDEATISPFEGIVTEVRKTALNDHEVFLKEINGPRQERLFVPRLQDLIVKKDDLVKPGQALSTGTINPRQLAGLRGVGHARHHLSTALREAYGSGLDPRHFEILAKNLAKHVEVTDPGKSDFVTGEKVEVKRVQEYLAPMSEEVPVEKALGKVLTHNAGHLTPGTLLSKHDIEELKAEGISSVQATNTSLRVKGIVPGLESSKLLDPNWVSRLAFNRIKDTVREAGALGQTSVEHSIDPMTSYVLGREFGQGTNGKY